MDYVEIDLEDQATFTYKQLRDDYFHFLEEIGASSDMPKDKEAIEDILYANGFTKEGKLYRFNLKLYEKFHKYIGLNGYKYV